MPRLSSHKKATKLNKNRRQRRGRAKQSRLDRQANALKERF